MTVLLFASVSSVFTTIWHVFLAFVILMFMVMIHETGHYAAGKLLKFKINEFSIGMGPKLFTKTKKNGEKFSLRALPLGGFCAFEGENEENPSPEAFNSQKPWKRLIVLFSGALFNFISAIVICMILFGAYGETVAVVNKVYDYAPAQNQVLQEGDIIYKINGKKVFVLDSIGRYMSDNMEITVLRDGKEVTLKNVVRQKFTTPFVKNVYFEIRNEDGRILAENDTIYKLNGQTLFEEGQYKKLLNEIPDGTVALLVTASDGEHEYQVSKATLLAGLEVGESSYTGIGMSQSYKTHKFAFGTALGRVFPYCGEVAMLVLRTLGGLFTGAVGLGDIGGPITTISMTSQVVSYGFASVLSLIVLISVNLAVFNLLPVPALDGCQMIFVLIEWIARKPVNRKVQAWINGVGLVLLLGFVILVDLLKL
ncbi:MAG: RIP metalloprotease RseP [Corallococcus sp.]|nr:RIP metalloprotease RseP [Corallococcus sp.]MCM1359731.1 RIP metalloprotease RseP [Corallococcus sp.]MCM1395440.1 RIP metalloprotease RseP [Corallococcus sp.]